MPQSQTKRPSHFNNRWRIAGAIDEHEHAQRACSVIGYELDEDGKDLVRVRLLDDKDEPGNDEVLVPPHLLLPIIGKRVCATSDCQYP